ncbi:hypothetical protein NEOKW01_1487 [Nematocida sp. AWRm80]|nr:hypothetical protein NEOKW01_1487 [Nematocida sp. AWRm80]
MAVKLAVEDKENKNNKQAMEVEERTEKRKPIPLDYESIQKTIDSVIEAEEPEESGISLKIPDKSTGMYLNDVSPFTFKENNRGVDESIESNYQCCGESLPTLYDLVSHYEKCHYKFISTENKKEGLKHVKWHGGESHNEIVQVPTVVFNDNSISYDYSKPAAFYNTILQSESLSLGVLLPPVLLKDFNLDAEIELLGDTQYKGRDKKRPFKCTHAGCKKKYTSAYGLKYHMSKGHINGGSEGDKPYACDVPGCDKRYKNANGLKYHFNNGH